MATITKDMTIAQAIAMDRILFPYYSKLNALLGMSFRTGETLEEAPMVHGLIQTT